MPPDQSIVCGRLTVGSCPLDSGETATYNMQMPILDEYPITPLVIDIYLQNIYGKVNNSTISCFSVPAETVLS